MEKIFTVAQIRDLLKQVSEEKITFSRFVEILNEHAQVVKVEMNFKEELQKLSENHNSPKLDCVKKVLKNRALFGQKTTTLNSSLYDDFVSNWLKSQGLEVKETLDYDDGYFITVTWS